MAFDGITLHSIVKELQILENAKVNQIYQPQNNNIILGVYNGNHLAINIDTTATNYRINLTTHSQKNPITAPNFCMILRKYLVSSKIKRVYMLGLERIFYIEFECFNEMNDKILRTLAIELMGKYSNVILYNENGFIIDALKKFDSEGVSRDIMPARKYTAPLSNKLNFCDCSLNDFISAVNAADFKNLDSSISNIFTGISKLFIQGCLEDLHLSNTISDKSLKDIYNYIKEILDNDFAIAKEYRNNYTISLDNNKDDLQVNFFLDDFYYNKAEEEYYITYRNNLLKVLSGTLDKLTKKMNNINDKIASCEDMEHYKIYGELLIANIYRFENTKLTELEIENYYDNNNIVKIQIDNSISISQNAEKYFKKYNKLKNTLAICKVQEKETSKELQYLESLVQELDNCNDINDVDAVYTEISENILFADLKFKNKKAPKNKVSDDAIKNYIKTKVDDFDVFVGKNNKQNDYLTLKVANDNDYWFHTKDIHGSHLILRCNGEMPKISTIQRCAEICAYYSKAKFSSHVPVDYCLAKYVKKPHGAVPGYVIYTNNKTIYADPKQI